MMNKRKRRFCATQIVLLALLLGTTRPARADEGGVSFWLPGQMGSFSAAPAEPGLSLATIYYHSSTSADADVTFPRSGRVTAGLDVKADLAFIVPSYAFETPLFGAQAAVSLAGAFGHVNVNVEATLTGPNGENLAAREGDGLTGAADLYPMGSLKWTSDVHNFMVYTMLGVPVGSYDVERLANLGTNHWSIDGGGGYSYLDEQKGHEFSAVLGFTYNFENSATNYQNGVSAHLDWAASQFLSAQTHVGLVGYFYNQITGDRGEGAVLGDFKAQVASIGPQVGYFFPVCKQTWYANLKGYFDSAASNRPRGWNLWLTLAIPLVSTKK